MYTYHVFDVWTAAICQQMQMLSVDFHSRSYQPGLPIGRETYRHAGPTPGICICDFFAIFFPLLLSADPIFLRSSPELGTVIKISAALCNPPIPPVFTKPWECNLNKEIVNVCWYPASILTLP